MATEPQQIPASQPAGQPAVLAQATAPPSYSSLQPDQQKQQLPPGQQIPVQPQQGVPFQAWPQGQVYQQPAQPVMAGFPQQGPVQYIAVSDHFGVYKIVHDCTTVLCQIYNIMAFNIIIETTRPSGLATT